MTRNERMIEMRAQIVRIIALLERTKANEIEVAAILSNLALSHNVPAHIFVNGKKKIVRER